MSKPQKLIKTYTASNIDRSLVVQGEGNQTMNEIRVDLEETTMTGDNINQSGTFGVGVNQGEIKAEKLAGTINEAPFQNLTQVGTEIQQILEQLDQTYPTETVAGQMQAAQAAMQQIESNMPLADRILSALRAGGTKALEKTLNHPAATFVLALLEDWQKTKNKGN